MNLISIEIIIPTLCMLLGMMLIKISWSKFLNKQAVRGCLNFSLAIFLLSIGSIFFTLAIDYDTFQRLTREHPVASIEFHKLGKQHFQAKLTAEESQSIFFELRGDQWQLDARVIKWNGTAAWSGLSPLYRLERISGRYINIELEKSAPRSVYSLGKGLSQPLWNFLIKHQQYIPWLDAYYGSATYLPMSHGAIFDITIGATGLIAKAGNEKARKTIENW